MKRAGRPFCSLFLALSLVAACVSVPSTTKTQVSGFEKASPAKKVAVLRGPAKNGRYNMPACIAKSLSSAVPKLKVVSPDELEKLLSPPLERDNPPKDENALARLLERRDVRVRLRSMDLTHLIFIRSEYEVEKHGWGSCRQGCVGAESAKEEIRLSGVVWDLQRGAQFGRINVNSIGTSRVAAFLIPVGLIAFPEKAACDALVSSLQKSWLKQED
ncbi:MAG: hypothetical protein R3229_07725 [Alphaproteobacteria bacterium]|nr:hypothetical protein [Alphaproteobacteria bacterium]